jgi:hypothetical protein
MVQVIMDLGVSWCFGTSLAPRLHMVLYASFRAWSSIEIAQILL